METVVCNLCGSPNARPLHEVQDWLLNRPMVKTSLVQCTSCGFIYQNPRPTREEIGEHYPPDYDPYQNLGKKSSWLMRKAIAYGLNNRARLFTNLMQPGILLDVGCAAGDFLAFVKQHYGWQVRGVEVSEYAARLARETYGLDVYTGTLEQACLPENSVDVVTMWDVLEHLHDPSGTLGELRRILKPGGLLALRLPNADSLDARIFGRYWSGLDAPRHLYVFSKANIRAMLTQQGYEVVMMTSKYGSYLGFILSLRFFMVGKQVNASFRNAMIGLLYSPFGRLAFAPAFFIYSLFQQSSQLSVVARVKK